MGVAIALIVLAAAGSWTSFSLGPDRRNLGQNHIFFPPGSHLDAILFHPVHAILEIQCKALGAQSAKPL
jgi:hypothetical protein